MPRGGWLSYFHHQADAEAPASLRLIGGAVSGAALSLSFTGLYLSIYSWVCIAILLLSLLARVLAWRLAVDFFTDFSSS